MSLTRREVCRLIPAAMAAETQFPRLRSKMIRCHRQPFHLKACLCKTSITRKCGRSCNENWQRATGEHIEAHATTLLPNGYPHPPHRHLHSEMWLIREGTVELTINGASHRLGPGGLGFVHSNEEHGIKSVGTRPATYFVVAIGPGADT
jgi:mannose-6-phosphate isomerase-like protein (cupin superfamily)